MMNIAYTYHGITAKVGGVSKYFYQIISQLQKCNRIDIVAKYTENIYFKELQLEQKEFLPGFSFKGKWRIEKFLADRHLKKVLSKNKFNIIHHTGEDPNVFNYTSSPIVITIHDMIPELFFQSNKKRINNRRICIEKANAIICVSEHTKKDLLRIYPKIDSSRIYVIYHGTEADFSLHKENLYGEYLLFVGGRNGYKNFVFLLHSIANILKRRNLKLVCTGTPFSKEENKLIDQLNIKRNIIHAGYVDEETLYDLYFHAKCFIYPSLYEGFGIPLLEAWKNQCPICISEASCFPEIAQDAACYFDPKDPLSLQNSINKILDSSIFRDELVEKGLQRINLFSWRNAALKTLNVYKKTKKNAPPKKREAFKTKS